MSSLPLHQFNVPTRTHRRLLVETSPGHFELNIDNTTLEKLLTCPRAFEIYAVLGRDSGERDALNYGSALHAALECWYKGGTEDEAIAALATAFDAKPCAPGSWRNFDHALATLQRYFIWRAQMICAPWEPITMPDGKLAVELPFKLPLFRFDHGETVVTYPKELVVENALSYPLQGFHYQSITVNWTGMIDLIYRDSTGAPVVLDHKTTSIGQDTFWGPFRLSSQMRGYCWAASKLLNEPTRSATIDALIGRKPSRTGIPHENEAQTFQYTDVQIDDWVRDTTVHITNILGYLRDGYFPQANVWCYNKYGRCPYFDACSMSKQAGATLLMSGQYAERTWNPLAKQH